MVLQYLIKHVKRDIALRISLAVWDSSFWERDSVSPSSICPSLCKMACWRNHFQFQWECLFIHVLHCPFIIVIFFYGSEIANIKEYLPLVACRLGIDGLVREPKSWFHMLNITNRVSILNLWGSHSIIATLWPTVNLFLLSNKKKCVAKYMWKNNLI